MTEQPSHGQYATVNGLNIYYETQGAGQPLLMLHGGFQTIEDLEPLRSLLARNRRVVAADLEGHGHTADLDRPLTYEQMAEDFAGLIEQLGIAPADVLGFSMGGMVALRLASKRPDLVRKLVAISAIYGNDGYYPSTTKGWPDMSPQTLVGAPFEHVYKRVAPHPERWPVLVEKAKHTLMDFNGWPPEDIRAIEAPALLALGDADLVRPEYAVAMFRLLGGAREDGGMAGVPASQLAILPGTTHFSILSRVDLLAPIITSFLDAPMPEGQ